MRSRIFVFSGTFLGGFMPASLWACAVCFGDPESKTTQAAIAGILTLLVITGGVLTGIAVLILKWVKNAKKLDSLQDSPAPADNQNDSVTTERRTP